MATPFIDNFNAGVNTALESWTPSGGTAWTLIAGGTAAAYQARTTGALTVNGTGTGAYTCDDQGSASQYTNGLHISASVNAQNEYQACRLVDYSNYIGVRQTGSGPTSRRISKVVGGTITDLQTSQSATTTWLRLEVDGSAGSAKVRLYDGGTGASPGTWTLVGSEQTVTDSVFDGETSQGVVRRGDSSGNQFLDAFEAGALGGGATYAPPPLRTSLRQQHLMVR